MSAEVTTLYSVTDVVSSTGLSCRKVTKLFENERGTIVYEAPNARPTKESSQSIKVPRHVYERVLRWLSVE